MDFTIKQISNMHKVRKSDALNFPEVEHITALAGQRVSYQLCLTSEKPHFAAVSVKSALPVKAFWLQDAVIDRPVVLDVPMEDYITHEPGLMPDILIPMEEYGWKMALNKTISTLWVRVDVPRDAEPGKYTVELDFAVDALNAVPAGSLQKTLTLEVLPAVMPEQKLIYTRWIYLDCIATAHNVPIFSEEHWNLIDKYIAAAADLGINMLLVPVHTPPLDTEVGTKRPCVQLVDIEKTGERYSFGFEKFHRYIGLCKKHGIRYFEIAHMFTQWGAEFTPNILVTENGKADYLFGWHAKADDPRYVAFLKQYIAAISAALEEAGISENAFFHISDEPKLENMEKYKTAAEIIRPLIGNSRTCDALSDYAFYEKGLVECPITAIQHIQPFLPHKLQNQWLYYCCLPQDVYPNAFMAMPSYRNRVLGFLLYKYDMKGFLHWGFNFYNGCRSMYTVDPYVTTSCDGAFPSGDAFIVYPGKKQNVYASLRGEITYEAIQDMNICFALEEKLGREAVVKRIDEAAGGQLLFDNYPKSYQYLENLRQQMLMLL
jgi:hypothetical protein